MHCSPTKTKPSPCIDSATSPTFQRLCGTTRHCQGSDISTPNGSEREPPPPSWPRTGLARTRGKTNQGFLLSETSSQEGESRKPLPTDNDHEHRAIQKVMHSQGNEDSTSAEPVRQRTKMTDATRSSEAADSAREQRRATTAHLWSDRASVLAVKLWRRGHFCASTRVMEMKAFSKTTTIQATSTRHNANNCKNNSTDTTSHIHKRFVQEIR
jgi:hypothetical protein